MKQFRLQFRAVRRRCVLTSKTECPKHTVAERARRNSRPYYFLCTPHTGAAAHTAPATLHATVLFHSVAARQLPPKRRFFLFFFLLLGDGYIPVDALGARGGTCVIDTPRRCGGSVFCTWYLYKNRLYIMIYWRKKQYIKSDIQHRRIAWMNDPVFCRRFNYDIGSRIRLLRSNRRIVDYSGSPLL